MTDTQTAPSARLWNRRYAAWFITDTSTDFTAGLAAFAIPLLALIATNDPALAGIIGAVGMITRLVSSLIGGVLADRHDRIRLMLVGCFVGLAISIGFLITALTDNFTFAVLMAVNVALSVRGGIFGTATQAALKDVVPEGALGRAQAANQGRDAVLTLASGPVGGALLALGAWLVGAVMIVAQSVGAIAALCIPRTRTTERAVTSPKRNGGAELREAFAWLFSRNDLRGTLLVTTIINLGVSTTITAVLYSAQQQGYSPAALGWISAGVGIGMLAGALVSPVLVTKVRTGVLVCVGLGMITLVAAVLPFVTELWAVTVLLGLGMMFAPIINSGLIGYFMVATPTELIGRANSAVEVFATGAMPVAPLVAGFGLALVGREWTLILAAGMSAIAVILAFATKSLRSLPVERNWRAHADANDPTLSA